MAVKTAYFTHDIFKEHLTGAGHPERPERMDAINQRLQTQHWHNELLRPAFNAAQDEQVLLCHPEVHLRKIRQMAARGGGMIDGDTLVSPRSFEAASMAVGAACAAVDAVMQGEATNAFCTMRPPGHHAETQRAMGFCLFNQIAIAARHGQKAHGLERVAIVDWDVHHGNGTQEIFYEDGTVFFASVHQWGIYPGTGRADETGQGKGQGTTLNFPLSAGADGAHYFEVWGHLGEKVAAFKPQLILVSAGFDAHARDPLAHMELQVEDFAELMRQTKEWAAQLCDNRVVCLLEGGYNLTALSESTVAVVETLKDDHE